MSETVRAIVAELRRRLEPLYGERLERMILFGSQARGDAEPDSDIDVLVVLRGEVRPGEEIERTSEVVSELSLKHDVVLSRVFFSTDRFTGAEGPFLMNVRREGIAV
jgi:predicted nucleotidyltransferase